MDIFDLSIEDFKEEMKKLVDEYTPEYRRLEVNSIIWRNMKVY